MHWCHSGSPCKTKFKQSLLMWKAKCPVFWDRWGILLIDFLTRGETVNAECYCETLQYCNRLSKTSGMGCLVLVLSCCMITLGHTWLNGQHISCRCSAGRCLIIHSIARTSRPVISIFLTTQKIPIQSAFSEQQRGRDERHSVVPIPGSRIIRHKDTKVGPMVWQMS